jgi:hypothetical protein
MTALHRRAAKRDASEPAIVEALEAYGFTVQKLSARHAPDLLLGRQGITRVGEVKTGAAALEPGQVDWWARWRGNGLIVLRSLADVDRLARAWVVDDQQRAA